MWFSGIVESWVFTGWIILHLNSNRCGCGKQTDLICLNIDFRCKHVQCRVYDQWSDKGIINEGTEGTNCMTENFNTEIPADLLTANQVKVDGVHYEFADGFPSGPTVKSALDTVDHQRAVSLFLNMVPVASLEAIRAGIQSNFTSGNTEQNWLICDDLMDSNSLYLTANTDTVYAFCILDLEKSGPVVLEIPPKCGPSTINDATFTFVVDMGAPGPDRSEGGKYLVLGPDYDGPLNSVANGETAEVDGQTYFIAHTPTYINWVPCRGMLVDGETKPASDSFRNGIKAYALKDKSNPPAMNWLNASGMKKNTIHSNHASFFEEIHNVIQKEPTSAFNPEILGVASGLGIRKGESFDKSAERTAFFEKAATAANAYARTVTFRPRVPEAYIYGEENSKWYTPMPAADYKFMVDGGAGGKDADSRLMFFYLATVNTPAMMIKIPGIGSQYGVVARDSAGEWLDGDRTYTFRLPPDAPAKDFWSFTVYDTQTRSMLQTDQKFPSVNSMRKDLHTQDDGSVLIKVGPNQPSSHAGNWIQTRPGKSWFAIFRLYGPLEPWFEKTWIPGEIEPN